MRNISLLISVVITVLITGCGSTIQVAYDYDKSADFNKYKTFEYYGWTDNSDKVINQFDKERIEEATGNELASRGLEYVKSDGDLVVSLFIVVDQKTTVTAYTDHYSMGGSPYGYPYAYGPGWGWGYGASTTRYQEQDYLVGTLVIDVFDKSERKLIWQGVGSKTVDENPQNRERNIQKAVASIMANYPVQPKEQ